MSSQSMKAQHIDFKNVNFSKSDSVAANLQVKRLNDVEGLTKELIKGASNDAEKYRAIFRWITLNIEYDYHLFLQSERKELKLKYERKKLAKYRTKLMTKLNRRLLNKKLGICYGYSLLLENMCAYAGLNCVVIEGYARQGSDKIGYGKINHAWNAVEIDSKWYLSDPTWASGKVMRPSGKFIKDFEPDYFLSDPFYFAAGHYPKNKSWLLLKDPPSLKDFLNAPIKLEGFTNYQLNQVFPVDGSFSVKRDSVVTFKFTSNYPDLKGSIKVDLIGKHIIRSGYMKASKDENGFYTFQVKFEPRDTYRVIIFLDRKETLLYQIAVY